MKTLRLSLKNIIFIISLLTGLFFGSVSAATSQEINAASLGVQADLFTVAKDPSQGAGVVSLVFFYDYNCPYSRVLDKIINEVYPGNNVKVIYKPLGIIDRFSPSAAKAVLAASKQGKFKLVHDAFMKYPGALNEAVIQNILAQPELSSLDKAQYDQDYKNLNTEAQIFENRVLYEKVKLAGVPSVIAAKLDASNKVEANKLQNFSGVERQDLMYMIFQLKG